MDETEVAVSEEAENVERARVRAAARSALFGEAEEPVKIGRFVVVERLGAGGMGVVYEAYDPKLRREVAIKLVRSVDADSSAAARLEREAQAMARVSHPNVLPVFEVGEQGGHLFIAMELVRGETLGGVVRGTVGVGDRERLPGRSTRTRGCACSGLGAPRLQAGQRDGRAWGGAG